MRDVRGTQEERMKEERRRGQEESVRQESRVQLLQGTPNQSYALRGRGPPDKR